MINYPVNHLYPATKTTNFSSRMAAALIVEEQWKMNHLIFMRQRQADASGTF
jgi:hypothetical protein